MREIFLMKSRRSKFMACPVIDESFRQKYRMWTHLRKANMAPKGQYESRNSQVNERGRRQSSFVVFF